MNSIRVFAVLLAVAPLAISLGACSNGDAFVDRDYMKVTVKKQKMPGYNGDIKLCYSSDTPKATRDQMAAEACEVYGLKAALLQELPWQCRFTVPHLANYACVDPNMRLSSGAYVNPFSPDQVAAWRQQQQARGPADAAR
jgi:hypothetical protein